MKNAATRLAGLSLYLCVPTFTGCASDPDPIINGQDHAVVVDHLADSTGEPAAAACPEDCTPKTCEPVAPTNALVTNWKDLGPNGMFVDGDSYSRAEPSWWTDFFGGPYVYPSNDACSGGAPEHALVQTMDGIWHVSGTVGTWSGFGLWFAPCMVDFSAFHGISVEIWGEVGETKQLIFDVLTSQNQKPDACNTNVGTCDPSQDTCKSATTTIDVAEAPGTITTLLWSDFGSGSPFAGVDPTQITGLHFGFRRTEWNGVKTPPFPVDVHIGEVKLVP